VLVPARALAPDRMLLGEAAVAAAGIVYLLAVDPHDPRAWAPFCPVKLFTGLDCPGCGGLRLAHDLLHGDVRAAVYDNPFLLSSAVTGARCGRAKATRSPGRSRTA
jgi:hypothetical protein